MCDIVFDEEFITVDNRDRVGFVGEQGRCAMYLTDGSEPLAVIRSNNDIYMEAGELHQMDCKTLKHNVSVECVEIYKKMKHTVNNDKTSEVGGNYTLTVKTNHEERVTGTQLVEVGGAQTETYKAGQTITVSGGPRNLTVNGDQVTTITGNLNGTINGSKIQSITGPDTNIFNASKSDTVLGSCILLKASSEQSLTFSEKITAGLAFEASLTVGASEKVNIGAHAEQNFAKKHVVTMGTCKEIALGPKKNESVVINEMKGNFTKVVGTVGSLFKARVSNFKYDLVKIKGKIVNIS